jgi:hypothetical protein
MLESGHFTLGRHPAQTRQHMLNSHDLAVLFCMSSVGLLTTTLGFAILWVRARERAIRATLETRRAEGPNAELTHLVHSIDAIAVEVERISEAQRFTVQLLGEKDSASAPKRVVGRVITPH